jgi:hypothetical protein
LLAELPPRLPALIDTTSFRQLDPEERAAVERLGELTHAYLVAYDLRNVERGLPLCTAVGQAWIGADEIAALQAVEDTLPPHTALVAYARPVQVRLPEEVLVRAARAIRAAREDRP